MIISFQGQVAIVTGAGRGLGREYALDIARRGGSVVIADIGQDADSGRARAEMVVEEIERLGGRAVAATENVATSAGGAAIVAQALETFGRVDVVIHNAGFLRPGFFDELSDDAVQDVLDVHLGGAFNVGRPAWKSMKARGYGRIVLTGSGAIFGYHASSNYAAAKAAMIGLTTALANEGAEHGIKVNAILPFAQSDIGKENPVPGSSMQMLRSKLDTHKGRWQPDSVSALVTHLASANCESSGHIYSAVAGRYARVALAVAQGWLSVPELPSPEEIGAHFEEINRLDQTDHPASMIEEMKQAFDRL